MTYADKKLEENYGKEDEESKCKDLEIDKGCRIEVSKGQDKACSYEAAGEKGIWQTGS